MLPTFTIFWAKFLGIFLIVAGVGLLLNPKKYALVIKHFIEHSVLLYLISIIQLLLGLFIILTHNLWVKDWPVLITFFGWFLTLRGGLRLAFPNQVLYLMRKTQPYALKIIRVASVISLLFGALLLYLGFFPK